MRLASLVPQPVKEMLKDGRRYSAVRRSLKPLKANGTMTRDEVAAFSEAWAGGSFAADVDMLYRLLSLLKDGPVLECGTGATTMLLNIVGLKRGFKTYSLEQDMRWGIDVTQWGPEAVDVIEAPLRNYGGYHWYGFDTYLPPHFSLIVCDGPYIDKALGEPSYSAWRYGLLPWLKTTDKRFDAILFDDVNDPRGPALLKRWQNEFGVKVERIKSDSGECAILTE